jgi:hypothetical protein
MVERLALNCTLAPAQSRQFTDVYLLVRVQEAPSRIARIQADVYLGPWLPLPLFRKYVVF